MSSGRRRPKAHIDLPEPLFAPPASSSTRQPARRAAKREPGKREAAKRRAKKQPRFDSDESDLSPDSDTTARRAKRTSHTASSVLSGTDGDDTFSTSSSEHDDEGDGDYDDVPESSQNKKGSAKGKGGKKERTGISLPRLDIKPINKNISDWTKLSQEVDSAVRMNGRSFTAEVEVPDRASKVKQCPFCRGQMPKRPSKKLQDLMQRTLDAFHRGQDMSKSTATLELCILHREEHEIIPQGKEKGWPTTLDCAKLKSRALQEEKLEQLRTRIDNPDTSDWFNEYKTRSSEAGKGLASAFGNLHETEEINAGYYGEQGYGALHEVLTASFLKSSRSSTYNLETLAKRKDCRFAPLSAQAFIERVLMPELVCILIREDHQKRDPTISLAKAKSIRDESHKYGTALFPVLHKMEGAGHGYVYLIDGEDDDKRDGGRGHVSSGAISIPGSGTSKRKDRSKGKSHSQGSSEVIPLSSSPLGMYDIASSKRRRTQSSNSNTDSCPVPLSGSPSRPRPRPSGGGKGTRSTLFDDTPSPSPTPPALTHSSASGRYIQADARISQWTAGEE